MNRIPNRKKKILLVENELILASVEAGKLQRHGYDVEISSTGEKAVEYFRSDPDIDLVLMDIDLGKGMCGPESSRNIMDIREVPVVFLTSHSSKEMVDKVKSITRYGYVIKNSGDFVLLSSIEMAFELFESHEKTRLNEEKYRRLHESMRDAFIHVDMEGNILEWNTAYEQMLGYSGEELACLTYKDITPEKWHRFEDEIINKQILKHGFSDLYQKEYRKKSGIIFPVELLTSLLTDKTGIPIGMWAIVRDISKRKQDEADLESAKEFAENLIQTANVIVVGLDISGNILIFNKAAEKITGYTRQDLSGLNWFEKLVPKERYPEVWEVFSRLPEGKLPTDFENPILTKDGQERNIVWSNNELLDKGRITGSISFGIDVTERKQAEGEVRRLLHEKELILKEVHHRIKNNMNTIMSLLSLQADTISNISAISALQDARNRIRSMMVIYDKLYRSSDYRNVSVRDYMVDLLDEISSALPLNLKVIIEKEVAECTMDSKVLFLVGIIINELICNSLKYAFPNNRHGKIHVSVNNPEENHFEIRIKDNGIGFEEHPLKSGNGGFGLNLVNLLVQQIGGKIDQNKNHGTEYIITFNTNS